MARTLARFSALFLGGFLLSASCAVNTSNVVFDDERLAELNGGGGDGGDGNTTPCVHGAPGCDGNQPQVCASGQWFPEGPPCDFACVNGVCTGSCVPDTTQCVSATDVQVCSAFGKWSESTTCEFACLGDDCGGTCEPGVRACDEAGNVSVCGEDGRPVLERDCGGSGCSDGLCGSCEMGEHACISPTSYRTCDGGTFGTEVATCEAQACSAVGGPCIGVCSPESTTCKEGSINRVVTCGLTGAYDGTEFDCPFVCASGRCSGECVPGQYRCSGSSVELCTEEGYFEAQRDCSESGESCIQVGAVASCGGCESGTARCAAAGGREVCSMANGWTVEFCGETAGCYNGQCQKYSAICQENQFASGCADSGEVWLCQGGSVFFSACLGGYCSNGTCQGGGPSPI